MKQEQAAALLELTQQKHRLPQTPVRARLLEAFEEQSRFQPLPDQLPVMVHANGSVGTFRVRVPLFNSGISSALSLRSHYDIGEVGLSWRQDTEERVVVWRPLCGYPLTGGDGPDYAQPWRKADNISDGYALTLVCLLQNTYPELAADVCYRAATMGMAGDPHLAGIVRQLGHRNVQAVIRESDERPYYDPDEGRVVPALAARVTRLWHTRAFRVHHNFRGDMEAEPMHHGWSWSSTHPDIYIIAMDHRRRMYDIRFGTRIGPSQRQVIERYGGRLPFSGSSAGQAFDSAANYVRHALQTTPYTGGAMNWTHTTPWARTNWDGMPDISQYSRTQAPDWLTDEDNDCMGLGTMSIPGTPTE